MDDAPLPALDRFDIVSPAARSQIHAIYREMRAAGPIHRFTDPLSKKPSWVVLSFDGALEVLRNSLSFIRDETQLAEGKPRGPLPRGLELVFGDMVHKDPPEHTRLRQLINRAFTTRVVEGLRGRVQAIVQRLLDAVEGRDEFDLVADFALPLPVTVISEMLGLSHEVRGQVQGWAVDAFSDDFARTIAALNNLRDLVDPLVALREAEPGDDLISALIHARTANGERLRREELHSMVLLVLFAGFETTVNQIGNGFLALGGAPEARRRMIAAPETAIPPAIEEMLRFDGPADLASVRFAAVDVEIEGVMIRAGEQVFPSLLAANRDPAVFADPDRFNIDRDTRNHIAFGSGVHSCVGAPLARLELFEAFSGLFARRPGLALAVAPEALEWKPSRMLHGLVSVPVRGR
ncbi:MAG: cytochrome P450 [Myxococcales bacterium]|nr:cytochrome P450 [Myxococcales bacterium]